MNVANVFVRLTICQFGEYYLFGKNIYTYQALQPDFFYTWPDHIHMYFRCMCTFKCDKVIQIDHHSRLSLQVRIILCALPEHNLNCSLIALYTDTSIDTFIIHVTKLQ